MTCSVTRIVCIKQCQGASVEVNQPCSWKKFWALYFMLVRKSNAPKSNAPFWLEPSRPTSIAVPTIVGIIVSRMGIILSFWEGWLKPVQAGMVCLKTLPVCQHTSPSTRLRKTRQHHQACSESTPASGLNSTSNRGMYTFWMQLTCIQSSTKKLSELVRGRGEQTAYCHDDSPN